MRKNIGKNDRAIRFPFAILTLMAGFYFQTWWGLLGVVVLTTGLIQFSPIYKLLGISTRGKTGPRKVVL